MGTVAESKKKSKKTGFIDILDVTEPVWVEVNDKEKYNREETAVVPFLTTKSFICSFLEFQVRDTEYIKTADVDEFVNILFSDVNVAEVNVKSLKLFASTYVAYFQFQRKRWVSMSDLYKYLEPLMKSNFFLNFRGRLKYSSVDVMQIWTYYNKDNTMTLDEEEATTFVFDLLQQDKQRCNPRVLKAVISKLTSLSGEEKITLRGLTKLLPLENSIMRQYEQLQGLEVVDQERILSFYDQNDEGQISGCELYALIKDILEANGQEDPYNMEVVLDAVNFLQEEGAISPMGNLDKRFCEVVFSLGLQ